MNALKLCASFFLDINTFSLSILWNEKNLSEHFVAFNTLSKYNLLWMASFVLIKRVNFIKWFQFYSTGCHIHFFFGLTFNQFSVKFSVRFDIMLLKCARNWRKCVEFNLLSRHVEQIIIVQVFKSILIK